MNAVRLFALIAFAFGNAALLYFVVFLGDFAWAPATVNRTLVPLAAPAWVVDLALIALFGVQHSVMARPGFKSRLTMLIPGSAERSHYVFCSALALTALMLLWQPMPSVVWDVGLAAPLIWAVFALGWALVFTASNLIDPLELFGLKQAFTGRVERVPFKTPWLYRQVRHPIMLGSLLAVWAAPVMTQGRFFLAVGVSAYIALALPFEERDLRAAFGAEYDEYARRVPALIPGWVPAQKQAV